MREATDIHRPPDADGNMNPKAKLIVHFRFFRGESYAYEGADINRRRVPAASSRSNIYQAAINANFPFCNPAIYVRVALHAQPT